MARASTTDGSGVHAIYNYRTKHSALINFNNTIIYRNLPLQKSQTMTFVALRMFQTSQTASSVPRHPRTVMMIRSTTVRMLEHTRYEAAALMPDCPTKGNPARHMPTRLLAVSSRKRYCLVTGPRYCKSPLCLERLLYSPGQSNPTPYHLNSMHASLNAN